MLAAWLKDHFEGVWWAVFLFCSVPALTLFFLYGIDDLGSNPLATLLHTSGRSALVLLAITLTVTPLRRWLTNASKALHGRYGKRLSDWNWLIRLRRQLGLWCFAYAAAHAWVYVHFDLGYDVAAAWVELNEKPYLLVGVLAFLMLVPLAVTSPPSMMRRLGRNWRRLHMLTYVIAVMALLHFWWMTKPGLWTPWPDTVLIALLLGYRAAMRAGWLERWDGFDGRESATRAPHSHGMQTSNSKVGEAI
jgi:sulfoxide reductase heme-binding subunit YedZ